MRNLILLLVFFGAMATPALAAEHTTPVTVDQLSRIIDGARGGQDARLAGRLSALTLTQRPDPAMLARWETELPGPQTRLALIGVVDASVFLDPPPDEAPVLPRPDFSQIRQILLRSADYVKQTVPRLPDFSAVRTTTYFVEAPPQAPNWPNFCKNAKKLVLGSGCTAIGASDPYPRKKAARKESIRRASLEKPASLSPFAMATRC